MDRAAREAQRAARRVRLDAGGRRAADGGAADCLAGLPAGAKEPAGRWWGGCLGGGGVAGEALVRARRCKTIALLRNALKKLNAIEYRKSARF